jgi:hypothetical protein
MPPQPNPDSSSPEGKLFLAIQALQHNASLSIREAAKLYNVSRSTLRDRRAGSITPRDCKPNSIKLTVSEESAIIQHIFDLDTRGFPPTKDMLRDMANKLLAERYRDPVGKNWPDNFIKRTPELKTRWTRAYDRQRALNEDSQVIGDWFRLVRSVKEKYGILDQDTYNFDETGFMMGVISSQLVVTGAYRRGKPKMVQSGNREWTTVIQGINALGWAIPTYIIFAGKNHISSSNKA